MDETDEEWVADYLRLEYGEDISDPDSIKASDITHLGEFIIDGIVTDYFSYPQSGDPIMWAIIQTIDDKDCVGMTSNPPPGCSVEKKLLTRRSTSASKLAWTSKPLRGFPAR